ncbi:hypothetical protein HUT19_13060 [Streptomyces sp. NA02950]|uniref:hypothetical protein n=1 Tax=Streptomyces sp. NA02950 TaxID=2742137 RepID=UPI0015926CC5|nr:hypothetical protein [Streptomyces sp. NA02950]QKV92562.1 hypothetical protein HUT19_13060 [Streptomyces sp. NA02950]
MADSAAHTPAPGTPAPDAFDRRAWIPPLLSMLLSLPLTFFLSIGVGFAGMACDVGSSAEISRCNASVPPAATVYFWGLLLPLALLVAGWVLPWRRSYRFRRGILSLLVPGAVFILYCVFNAMVDWPPEPSP